MKKIISLFLSFVMLLTITEGLDLTAFAGTYSGTCGDNLTWSLDTDTGELKISGSGDMNDYMYIHSEYAYPVMTSPWVDYSSYIKTVTISKGVTSIGEEAFEDCTSLTSVTIPDSVTSIGDWAFCGCTSLTAITVPDSVKKIGDYTFGNCISLISIDVDSNNGYYSSQDSVLFNKDKTNLIQYPIGNTRASYAIPNSVTSINDSAFEICTYLTSITIPDSITVIGDGVFYGCSSLTCIEVAKNNEYYSSQDGVLFNKDKTELIQYPIGNAKTSYEIPMSVTIIDVSAFSGCASLTSIMIPDSVISIGENVLYWCTSLISIEVAKNNEYYSSQDGVLFNKDKTELIQYPIGNAETSYEIPNSAVNIDDYAFFYCKNLTRIIIPDSIINIGDWAFSGCTSLTTITIPDSVVNIGDWTFCNCTSLTNVSLGESVTSVEDSLFSNCDKLEMVKILNPNCEISSNENTISESAVINGYKNSSAQEYAQRYDRKFKKIINDVQKIVLVVIAIIAIIVVVLILSIIVKKRKLKSSQRLSKN